VDLNRKIVARLRFLQKARTRHQMLGYSVVDRIRFRPPAHDAQAGVIVKRKRQAAAPAPARMATA
jgi:hypothetical protein